MVNFRGISAYQQENQTHHKPVDADPRKPGIENTDPQGAVGKEESGIGQGRTENTARVQTRTWSPIESGSSLIPQKTEYGYTVGNVQLSDKAKAYYEELKSQFGNLEFIVVSGDMKELAQKNAASYGNASKMVVLIDEEKLERMATDESFRKKYEGIIAMAQHKLTEAKNSFGSTGAAVKNFGMSVDSDGKESFFATVEKSLDLQKQRIEEKAAEKKEQHAKEKKAAERERTEYRLEKIREKKAEAAEALVERTEEEVDLAESKEHLTFESDSMERLLDHVRAYSYDAAAERVVTEEERMLGTQIDLKG